MSSVAAAALFSARSAASRVGAAGVARASFVTSARALDQGRSGSSSSTTPQGDFPRPAPITPAGQSSAMAAARALLADKADSGAKGWNEAWVQEATPWDSGSAQPALLSTLEEADSLVPTKGQALIAGCGRGYDSLVFAERGLDALGIDISEVAVQEANKWLESQADGPARNRVRFEVRDFFALDPAYDLAYDYTFFCALPLAWRARWAETYARIIRPGGVLIAVVFPIKPNAGPEGPPFKVSPEEYKELLSDAFELQWEGVPARQTDTHVGIEQVQIWSRK